MADEDLRRAAKLARQLADHTVADALDLAVRDHERGSCTAIEQGDECYREVQARDYLAVHRDVPLLDVPEGAADLVTLLAAADMTWNEHFGDPASLPDYIRHLARCVAAGRALRYEPTSSPSDPKKRAETTCANGPTAENPATTPPGVTPAPTTSPREPWRTTTSAATALATQSPTDPTEHAAATPTEPRVWRHGDPEPGPDVYGVRLSNGEVLTRWLGAGGLWWTHESGKLFSWHGVWEMAGNFVTEVVEDQPGGES